MAETETEPQLQAPGAGLPRFEAFVTRLGVRYGLPLILSRAKAGRQFRAEADRVLALVRGLTPEQGAKRVLIDRLARLEDSSRYWSAYMTVEHLVIVNTSIIGVIESLVAGRTIAEVASTAAVKPNPGTDASVIERFEANSNDYLARVERLPDLRTATKYAHPWFGPLSAAGWHRMAAVHNGIHRKQIESIVRGLPRRVG